MSTFRALLVKILSIPLILLRIIGNTVCVLSIGYLSKEIFDHNSKIELSATYFFNLFIRGGMIIVALASILLLVLLAIAKRKR